jgi:hypothetical protein
MQTRRRAALPGILFLLCCDGTLQRGDAVDSAVDAFAARDLTADSTDRGAIDAQRADLLGDLRPRDGAADAGPLDRGGADLLGPRDGAVVDTEPPDMGRADSSPGDGAAVDRGAVDLSALDSSVDGGVVDASAPDLAPPDALPPDAGQGMVVGKWGRQVISLTSSSYSGNPFEVAVDATFTHLSSATSLTLPGYYAGNDTWKVAFMPTLVGTWSYLTSSPNADLNGATGSIECVPSGAAGMLLADETNLRKWRYADGDYVVPIGVFVQLMHGSGSGTQVESMADFLEANELHLVNFRLCEHDLCFADVGNLQLDLALWDRLETRIGILAQRGLGVDIMLFTDDAGQPSYGAQSAAEALLVRYMIARFASFPVVLFNTGIDIWEYRGSASSWHDWYGNLVKSLDPYGHPVSSRRQDGRTSAYMTVETYNSRGDRNSTISRLTTAFNAVALPAANNDNWGEDRTGINGHTPGDIRRAAWKATVAGGVAFHVRHNQTNDCALGQVSNCDNPFTVAGISSELDSEQWLNRVNPFVNQQLGSTFGAMVPEASLASSGYALADPARTTIVVLYVGVNDTWDPATAGPLGVELQGVNKDFDATWFDPRTGQQSSAGTLSGNTNHQLTPPSSDDWVLLLEAL